MLKTLATAALAFLFAFPQISEAASSQPTRQEHTTAQLHSEFDAIDGKTPFYVLFHLTIDPEWHTYWKNPGDSGIPTQIDWQLPAGWRASEILWQPPRRLAYGPLMNYGYSGNAYHVVQITPPEGFNEAELPIKATANWLVCKEECIPESAEINLVLQAGTPVKDTVWQGRIAELVEGSRIPISSGNFMKTADGTLALYLPQNALLTDGVKDAYFFPDESAVTEPAAKQALTQPEGGLRLDMTPGAFAPQGNLTGVLELALADGRTVYRAVTAQPGTFPEPATHTESALPASTPTTSPSAENPLSLVLALAFALLGGMILNAMPCVFPVLSLKALGLSQKSAAERRKIRAHGYSYTAGVVGSFAVVGLVLILLKLSGSAIGWGYQMQSPLFVAGLTYLLFLIGLNLGGYFDVTFHMSVNPQSGEKETLKGSFMMGALVTLVATPCSAPFMATALGVALSQPPVIGMAIFIVMGFGLALPYLLLTTVPGALKWMPKPGIWMERFKQFLAFPMFFSAIWLAWVFMLQTSATATALLLMGLVLAAFGIWLGRVLALEGFMKAAAVIILGALALSPLLLIPMMEKGQPAAVEHDAETYSEEKLAALRGQDKPVFVYATAAWCITCKVNERVALLDASVKDSFDKRGITVMVADWTSEDPAITRFLEKFGRAGVPLYVFYPAGGREPRILPQLLTPTVVIDSTQ